MISYTKENWFEWDHVLIYIIVKIVIVERLQ